MQKIVVVILLLLQNNKKSEWQVNCLERSAIRFQSLHFFYLLAFSLSITLSSCSLTTTRPVQLMSDTAAALRAAREVQADTLAPELYRQASAHFFKAKQEYKIKNFLQAKELAKQAQKLAEEAEFEALRQGGLRQSGNESGFETEIRNPSPPPPPPPKSPRDQKSLKSKEDALLDEPKGEFVEAVEKREEEKQKLREIEAANKQQPNQVPPPPAPSPTNFPRQQGQTKPAFPPGGTQ